VVEPVYDTEDMFNFYENEARHKGRGRFMGSGAKTNQQPLWDEPEEKPKPKVVASKPPVKDRKANKKKNVGAIVDGVRIIDLD